MNPYRELVDAKPASWFYTWDGAERIGRLGHVTVNVSCVSAGSFGPLAWGYVWWGNELHRVYATPWFSLWTRVRGIRASD